MYGLWAIPILFTAMFPFWSSSTVPSPYRHSPVIQRITWNWHTHTTAAFGSDLWATTWGADGDLYSCWGDGGGFGGSDHIGRVSLGIARLEGIPQAFVVVNVNGGNNSINKPKWKCRACGKSDGILSVDGVLYLWINTQSPPEHPDFQLAWSKDLGAAWTESSWHFASHDFAPATFLNFGKDYAGARDNYIYFYGGRWGSAPKHLYMGRVEKTRITEKSAYEYFSGFNGAGMPTWSPNLRGRRPIFTDSNSREENASLKAQVVFNPGVGRYLLTIFHHGPGGLGIFDAPEPWGPWTTVGYENHWGGMGSDGEGLNVSFPSKWMSADGLTMWAIFSAYGNGAKAGINAHDKFNLVKATLTLKSNITD